MPTTSSRHSLPRRGSPSRDGGLGQATPGGGMNPDANRLRDRTLTLCEVESPTGDTAEVGAALRDDWLRGARAGGRAARRRLPRDADRSSARLTGGEPGPTVVLNGAPRHGPDPARRRRGIEGDARLRPRLGRHEGRARSAACRGGVRRGESGTVLAVVGSVLIGGDEAVGGRGEEVMNLLLNETRLDR